VTGNVAFTAPPEIPVNGDTSSKNPCTVSKYNLSVERRVKAFPTIWVKGVITQLNVRGKVAYLTLAEFDEGDARPKAVLDVIIWARQLEDFNACFARLPTPFILRPELKVSLLLESSFYVPTGRFQPRIVDVDEAFTLGELSLTRQKILEKLQKDGLLDRNKKLTLADIPLRVGLITSPGSAAYQDFTTVLLQSGFAFSVSFVSARMQGPATEDTVAQGLETLARLPLDVICIVRGGGSKTDLVFFDSEKICRAIALCPVPVLTGIGHEIDRSLADIVAYSDLLTPTDCAKFLESRVAEVWTSLRRRSAGLTETWKRKLQDSVYGAIHLAESLGNMWFAHAQHEKARQAEASRKTVAATTRSMKNSREKLRLNSTGILRGPQKLQRLEQLRYRSRKDSVQQAWWAGKQSGHVQQGEKMKTLRSQTVRLLGMSRDKLRLNYKGLARGPGKLTRSEEEALKLKDRLIQASDMVKLLNRGFALVFSPGNKLIRGAAEVAKGDEIRIQFADGDVNANVLQKELKP